MICSTIFQTFLLIVLSISGHNCIGYDYEEPEDQIPTEYTEPNLCDPYYRYQLEVISIFNLRKNIYIQTKDQNQRYNLWRIPMIRFDPVSTKSKLEIDPHNTNVDFVNNLQIYSFDLDKPIFASVIRRKDWPDFLKECNNTDANRETYCSWINDNDVPDLICVHGTNVIGDSESIPLLHSGVTGKIYPLWEVEHDRFVTLKDHCLNIGLKSPAKSANNGSDPLIYSTLSMLKWHKSGQPNIDIFIEKVISKDEPKPNKPTTLLTVQLYDKNGTRVSKVFEGIYNQSYISIAFYYNDFLKFLFCGHPCYLDSPLKWTKNFEPPPLWWNDTDSNGVLPTDSKIHKIEFHPILSNPLTLRTLINCETFSYQLFSPNEICSKRMNFRSIFNLGKDVYFQRRGRFWKYNGNGFTSDSNPFAEDLDVKISPVRYDSDFTAFLESEGFDTACKVVGVNFKTEYQDLCRPSDGRCLHKYISSENHFKVCLYGTKGRSQSPPSYANYDQVFYQLYTYTPSGLTRIPEFPPGSDATHKSFCRNFMTSVLGESNSDIFEAFSVTNPTNVTSFHYNYNDVYTMNIGDVRSGQVFVRHRWRKDKIGFSYKGVDQQLIQRKDLKRPAVYMFSMNGQIWGYSWADNGDLHRFIENHDPDKIYMEEKVGTNLYDLLNCPIIPSTSVMTPYRRPEICRKYAKREPDSVFNIGTEHYHQYGRYFYRWNDSITFHYDRQVTNLLNDYFDTSRKVMAYSFSLSYHLPTLFPNEDQQKEYAIVFYGTSHTRYRKLGKKVYALFQLNEHYMPTLIAVNDLKFPIHNTITFGSLSHNVTAIPKILSFFALNAKNRKNNESLFFAYIEDSGDSLMFRFTDKSSQLNYPFDSSVYKPEDWFLYNIPKKSTPFQQIVGFTHSENSLNIAVKLIDDENEIIQFVLATDLQEILITPVVKIAHLIEMTNKSWTLKRYKNNYRSHYCYRWPTMRSESDTTEPNSFLTSVLVFVLLILLIIALIVGITGYFRNEMNAKKGTENSEPNTGQPIQSGSNSTAKTSVTGVKPDTSPSDDKSVRSV